MWGVKIRNSLEVSFNNEYSNHVYFFNIRFNGFVRGDCYTWWCWHPVDFPSNQQFTAHFLEFLRFGYKAGLGSVQCKFPHRDGSRKVKDGTVGVVDGLAKIVILYSIVGFFIELEISPEMVKADPVLSQTMASMMAIRCTYHKFDNPAHHFLHSLRDWT